MEKVSVWLRTLGTHEIYDDAKMREKFKEATGQEAPWTSHTVKDTQRAIEARGLGGTLNTAHKGLLCYGWEMADACAAQFAKFYTTKIGRGFRFWDSVEALEKAGL